MPRESVAKKRDRVAEIIRRLRKEYPDARCALDHANPLELLVATILSAQCSDKKVNEVSPQLFADFKTPRDYAKATPEQIQRYIRSIGLYRNKSKSLVGMGRKIVEDFGGEVPRTMEGLTSLPGVARKTANVVLGNAFGKKEGIVVDTHVRRLAGRLKLTTHQNNQGDRIEKDLCKLVDREDWTDFAHLLIFHGRAVCTAHNPGCDACVIADLCPSAGKA